MKKLNRLVVHIGSHKTGTTSIQDFCTQERSVLKAERIYYPVGLLDHYPRQHSHLAKLLLDAADARLRAFFDAVVANAHAAGAETVFLSGEDLCAVNEKQTRLFAKIARTYFDELEFVFVVRKRKDYLLSQYKHFLTHGGQIIDAEITSAMQFSPRNTINIWTAHFSNRAIVIPYDEHRHDFMGYFFRKCFGIEVSSQIFSNVSIDYLTILIVNTLLKEWPSREVDLILWKNITAFPQKMSFGLEEAIASRLEKLARDADWIIDELDRPDCLLRDSKPIERDYKPAELCDKMIALFSALKEHFEQAPTSG